MKILSLDEFDPVIHFPDEQSEREKVEGIIQDVRRHGDRALLDLTESFDGVELDSLKLDPRLIKSAPAHIEAGLLETIQTVASRIRKMAALQKNMFQDREWEIEPGVWAGQTIIPVQKAGIYVPGGRYPLISSLLMGCIPAAVAGVDEIFVCSPPGSDGHLHPALLAAAETAGVTQIFKVGGAQAVAALAYGTESIPAGDIIAGPGNIYVNAAKKLVFGQVGIDFIAGPTEILVIADADADPEWVAADLIAQAEHDNRSRAVLITDTPELAGKVKNALQAQLKTLDTRSTAEKALQENGCILLTDSIENALSAANIMAPEHLQLIVKEPEKWVKKLRNYGTLFLGAYACEVLGDYSSGLNHVLPTNGAARYSGGLSVRHFLKTQTVLSADKKGFLNISGEAQRLAEAEGLAGHAHAIEVRKNPKS